MCPSWEAVASHRPSGLKAIVWMAEVWSRQRYVTCSGLDAFSARETSLRQ